MTSDSRTSLPDPMRSRAVLMGFAEYGHAPSLPAVANNLDSLRTFFTSPQGWGLPAEHCQVIDRATTADDLIAPLRTAASAARDTLLVYYAGHGILDEDLEFSLSLPSSRLDEPWTGVPYAWLRKFIARSRAKSRVVVIDSCFSGKVHTAMGSISAAVKVQAAAAGAVVITSARDDRLALAPEGEKYTAFTAELLTVLHQGIDGGPSVLTVDEVYESVKDALAAKGRPRPDRTTNDTSGRMGLAVNQAYVPDVAGPASLPSARESLKELVARVQQLGATPVHVLRNTTRTATLVNDDRAAKKTREQNFRIVNPDREPGNGRYINLKRLAQGGMGEIYLAEDAVLGRAVVLKSVLRVMGDNHPTFGHHLYYEARAVAALNHPSIASVYDFVDDSTGKFIVMEYVQGWDLGVVSSKTRLTIPESVAVTLDLLDGLEHSHAAGIIHCDIKPSNLVLAENGQVKILDFGISNLNSSAHEKNSIAATANYAAPEVWQGAAPDIKRDIYGAGVVLYELLTGESLRSGGTFFEIASTLPVVKTRELVPEVPSAVEKAVERALAPDPADRYQSAAQMRAKLSSVVS
ncbi:caspase, EACC1-associated type [Streptomyces xanthophaeus]